MVPEDILTIYDFLGQILVELTDLMAEEVREWRNELQTVIQTWKGGSPEPDWQAFREWMNEICLEDGMPTLFPVREEE